MVVWWSGAVGFRYASDTHRFGSSIWLKIQAIIGFGKPWRKSLMCTLREEEATRRRRQGNGATLDAYSLTSYSSTWGRRTRPTSTRFACLACLVHAACSSGRPCLGGGGCPLQSYINERGQIRNEVCHGILEVGFPVWGRQFKLYRYICFHIVL